MCLTLGKARCYYSRSLETTEGDGEVTGNFRTVWQGVKTVTNSVGLLLYLWRVRQAF